MATSEASVTTETTGLESAGFLVPWASALAGGEAVTALPVERGVGSAAAVETWRQPLATVAAAAGTRVSMASLPAVGILTPLAAPDPVEDLAAKLLALAVDDAVDAMRELEPRLELRATGIPLGRSIFVVGTGMDIPFAWKCRSK